MNPIVNSYNQYLNLAAVKKKDSNNSKLKKRGVEIVVQEIKIDGLKIIKKIG